jgi:hypothetical protein
MFISRQQTNCAGVRRDITSCETETATREVACIKACTADSKDLKKKNAVCATEW